MRFATLLIAAFAALLAVAPAGWATVVQGRFEVRHADDFRQGRSLTTYAVRGDDGTVPVLPTRPPDVESGQPVRVEGKESGGYLVGSVTPTRAAASAPATRTRRAAVLLINFTSDTSQPWTPDRVRQRFFTDPDSTAGFYAEESYGDLSLTGDVYGWYTLDQPTDGCDVDAWAAAARAQATGAGVDLSGYDHLVYVFPYQQTCWWAGLGDLPGRESWLNGYIGVWVAGHELGHNLGVHHASSLACTNGGEPAAYGPDCTQDEYGDPFDIMGDGVSRGDGWHLQQLGFLGPDDIQTVTTTGVYTLRSTLARGDGPRLLRIPATGAGSGMDQFIDLDLREPDGVFDEFTATDPVATGVSVHLDPDPSVITQSLLLDATPGSTDGFWDSALAPGQTFQSGDATVTVRSVSGGTATLAVTIQGSPDSIPPDAPTGLNATVQGTDAQLAWTAAGDNVAVDGYRVYRDGALVGTAQDTSYLDSGLVPGASYLYRVDAFDAAGNATASSPLVVEVPGTPPGDPGTGDPGTSNPPPSDPPTSQPPSTTTPPSHTPADGTGTLPPARPARPKVTVKSPRRGAVVRRRRLLVRVRTRGRSRVVRIVVRIDGKRRIVRRGAKLNRRISLRGLRRGWHRLTVRAVDKRGRARTRTVRFRYAPRHRRHRR